MEFPTVRTLKIAELNERDRRVGRTHLRIPIDMNFLPIGSERIGRHVIEFTAQERFAVFAQEYFTRLCLLAEFHLNRNSIKLRGRRGAQGAHRNLDIRPPTEEMPHKFLGSPEQTRLLGRHGCLRGWSRSLGHCRQSKRAHTNNTENCGTYQHRMIPPAELLAKISMTVQDKEKE